ncbi:MAG: DNA/RNA nuclease SfsA, partial [Enterorhabdus sp.]|nr:DNA/RNA nuclease SfsA [Enterorhabdus sp.]
MTSPKASTTPLLFPEPLREGVILARPNRFIMDVAFSDGASARCHCPAVSRIGDLDLTGRPCLVSDSHNPQRKLPLTVEAFSLQQPDAAEKQWIGINQNASNRYVEHFLRE